MYNYLDQKSISLIFLTDIKKKTRYIPFYFEKISVKFMFFECLFGKHELKSIFILFKLFLVDFDVDFYINFVLQVGVRTPNT